MNKKVGQGQATRERLIRVATALFIERGYEGTPIPAVLEAAGVSRGALYHHFDSKEALFTAVLEAVEAGLAESIRAAARPQPTPLEALRAGCATFLRLAASDPAVQHIVLLEAPRVLPWEQWRAYDEQYGLGGLKSSLQALADLGHFDADLVDTLAHMLLAALDEAAVVIARSAHPRVALRRGTAATNRLLDGLVTTT